MSKSSMHMSLEDRNSILKGIQENKSIREIGRIIGVHASTVSRELKKHRMIRKANTFNNSHSPKCKDPRLSSAPWVCHGCKNYIHCRKEKYIYDPMNAHKTYQATLKTVRRKVGGGTEAFDYLNRILTPAVKEKGQTLGHIYADRADQLVISRSTLYRYVDLGYLEIKNIDLPRRVRYASHRTKQPNVVKNTKIRINRTYLDFKAFVDKYPKASVMEIDSVIGKKGEGEKVLLTLLLEKSNFMMAFLRNQNDAQSVVDCFDRIEKTLGTAKFATMFYITLGDNGSEFSKADALEGSHRAFKRTHLFYCDARASQQKGKLEKNHEYIRKYFPQGTSFNCLTQDDVDLMMNHINSVKRESLGNKSPFQCLSRSETISIKKLGYNEIHPNDVILNPSLFKKK